MTSGEVVWDESEWFALPGGVSRIHRSDLGPCPCGSYRFEIREYQNVKVADDGTQERSPGIVVACLICQPAAAEKHSKGNLVRTKETHVGWFDGRTGRVEVTCDSRSPGPR